MYILHKDIGPGGGGCESENGNFVLLYVLKKSLRK